MDVAGGQPSALMECAPSACNEPSWSPDGAFLGFSRRRDTGQGGSIFSPPRPWMMHVESGEMAAILPDDQEPGFDVRWSQSNRWATYVSPVEGQIGLINLADGARRFFESGTGEAAAWHPVLDEFLFTRMTEVGDTYVTHLFLADIEGHVTEISGSENLVDDRNPAWSPDGGWIALRRKVHEGAGATRGSQLWLMRADGSDAVALTADPEADHGSPRWSPDGRYLIYHKLPIRGNDLDPSIWLLDVETKESQQITRPGRQPLWVVEP